MMLWVWWCWAVTAGMGCSLVADVGDAGRIVELTGDVGAAGAGFEMSRVGQSLPGALFASVTGETSSRAPGDSCTEPLVVQLPADLPYFDGAQHTCGRGSSHDHTDSCLGEYADGEDVVYRLNVTAPVDVEIIMEPCGAGYTGIALDESCSPLGPECLAQIAGEGTEPRILQCLHLDAGTYTLMVDSSAIGGCIAQFDLWINPCILLSGACCVAGNCTATTYQQACLSQGGEWYEGFSCGSFACPVLPTPMPEDCATAYEIPQVPFSAVLETHLVAPGGAPGSCNGQQATQMQNDVWLRFVAATSRTIRLDVEYDYNGLTAVWTGPDCQHLAEQYCLDSGWGQPDRDTVVFDAVAGTSYWIQIGDWGANPGGGWTLLALSGTAPAICRGDCNCDGSVGFTDIDLFVASIPNNQTAWQNRFFQYYGHTPTCSFESCDVNGNGNVGFDDIDPFVAKIPSPCPS